MNPSDYLCKDHRTFYNLNPTSLLRMKNSIHPVTTFGGYLEILQQRIPERKKEGKK